MLTSGGYQRTTARIIADSILNLHTLALITCDEALNAPMPKGNEYVSPPQMGCGSMLHSYADISPNNGTSVIMLFFPFAFSVFFCSCFFSCCSFIFIVIVFFYGYLIFSFCIFFTCAVILLAVVFFLLQLFYVFLLQLFKSCFFSSFTDNSTEIAHSVSEGGIWSRLKNNCANMTRSSTQINLANQKASTSGSQSGAVLANDRGPQSDAPNSPEQAGCCRMTRSHTHGGELHQASYEND